MQPEVGGGKKSRTTEEEEQGWDNWVHYTDKGQRRRGIKAGLEEKKRFQSPLGGVKGSEGHERLRQRA